jgi:hypothetical protein
MRTARAHVAAAALALCVPGKAVGSDGCNTKRCEARIAAKHKRQVVAPFRGWLAKVRACESGGNYRIISRSGLYYGAYQFLPRTWRAVGGRGMPHRASRLEQDYRAVLLLRLQGRGAWPVCG